MKKWMLLLLFLGLGREGILIAGSQRQKMSPALSLAVMQTVEHPALDATRRGLYDRLKERGFIEGRKLKWSYESAQGNAALAAQIAQKFEGQAPTVIVAIGTTAAQSFLRRGADQTPIVFSSITDPLGAGLVRDLKKPGGPMTGVSNAVALEPQVALIQKIIPDIKRLGIVYNPGERNSISVLQRLRSVLRKKGITLVEAMACKTVDVGSAAHSLVGKVDAIFITVDNTALSAFESVVKVAEEARIPVFSGDIDLLERGAIAALGPNQYALGQQTADVVLQILGGATTNTLPVVFPRKIELGLNLTAAKKVGIVFSETLRKQANRIVEKGGGAK